MSHSLKDVIMLEAGGVVIMDTPVMVRTLLGSCVGITFYHKARAIGAFMHGMYKGRGKSNYYIATAIDTIVNMFSEKGVLPTELEVKVFGGATLTGFLPNLVVGKSIGQLNILSALETLKEYNINVVAKDVECACPCDVSFSVETGETWVKRLYNEKTCASKFCKNQKDCPAHQRFK